MVGTIIGRIPGGSPDFGGIRVTSKSSETLGILSTGVFMGTSAYVLYKATVGYTALYLYKKPDIDRLMQACARTC
jgi:hypothetical protein